MNYRRVLSLVTGLVVAFALAIPAGAQTDEAPEQEDGRSGNPVAHCLPDQARGGDDDESESDDDESESDDDESESDDDESESDEGDESESDEGDEVETQTVTVAQQQDDEDAREDDDAAEGDEESDEGEDVAEDDAAEDDEESDEGDDARQDDDVAEGDEESDEGDDAREDDDADEDDEQQRGDVAQCVLESLPDIVGNAHAASVVAVVENGIAQGKADGTYGAQDPVTRAQMATFLSRALDLSPSENAELPDDVDAGNPHADAVAAVVEEAIALGKADGSFGPNESVSRGQMASFLDRALDLVEEAGGDLPEDAKGNVHEKAIEAVTDNGIAQGFTDGSFRPGDSVTRGQMATFLSRALDL